MASEKHLSVVLTGGGARGAYQGGVLKYIAENIPGAHFDTLVGSSSGAINVAGLASHKGCVFTAGPHIATLWSTLNMRQVFRTDILSLFVIGMRWMYDLIFGGFFGKPLAHALVDTRPLDKLLHEIMNFQNLDEAIDTGILKNVAISATEVYTGCIVTFVQSRSFKNWFRARKRSRPTKIRAEHIMASTSIPLLFPSVVVDNRRYLDGCIRSMSPLAPAARLGADKIFAVGVRQHYEDELPADWLKAPSEPEKKASVAQLGALVLNSLFAESLDADVDHLQRLNSVIEETGETSKLKKIDILVIRPSIDLGALAIKFHSRLPWLIRYLLRGLGSEQGETSDILSYLLFVPEYTSALVELGYRDAKARHEEIVKFFNE